MADLSFNSAVSFRAGFGQGLWLKESEMVGEGSRKLSKPSASAQTKAPTNPRRPSSAWAGDRTSSANTVLKGLTSFIVRSVSNNVTSEGKL